MMRVTKLKIHEKNPKLTTVLSETPSLLYNTSSKVRVTSPRTNAMITSRKLNCAFLGGIIRLRK